MQRAEHFVKMFLYTTGLATLAIAGGQMLQDRALDDVLAPSFGWALVAAAAFTARRYYLWKTGAPCAICVEGDEVK
ncbi:hypothetical protein E4L96_01030 [Massilia arenosa]|uniref:Uncharacterized protein n=1 Tax=Zemynaea arenosa TaxID=2561931 RepID=A0A4Y9STM3_9BURK|nr:hypothetical protein [Massilia arenosa]TFW29825.1 hypothetical protein E4L96_01030 [Massilia arenosa]